jgi:hypothetical protein
MTDTPHPLQPGLRLLSVEGWGGSGGSGIVI